MAAKSPRDYNIEIGARLRALRLSYAVKQTDLATRLGVQRAAVTRWEQGSRGLTVDTLLRIADTFRIPGSRLLPEDHQEHEAEALTIQRPTEGAASLEESAIAHITLVLHERPDLLPVVMQVIEQQILVSVLDGIERTR